MENNWDLSSDLTFKEEIMTVLYNNYQKVVGMLSKSFCRTSFILIPKVVPLTSQVLSYPVLCHSGQCRKPGLPSSPGSDEMLCSYLLVFHLRRNNIVQVSHHSLIVRCMVSIAVKRHYNHSSSIKENI